MRSIIVSTVLLLFLITNYNGLAVAIAQEEDFTISINPGATNSASQNPIAPENLTISKDTTVTWVNKDSTYHQIVSGNPDTGPSNIFYGDYFGPSESYNVTFDNAGIYQYYDPNWSHINGQITVEDVETTTETGTIENTSDMTSSIDQVSNETNVANEIKPNASMIDNIAPISSLLGSIASGENHTNQSSASALSTLSTDPTLDSIIDKVRPFFNLLSGENNNQSSASISSLLGSIASGENHTNQSSASALSTLSTDPTLDSIIDKVRPFFNLLSGENSLNGTLDSIISASNQTLEENPIPETNLSSIEPKLLSGENIDPVMNNSFSLQNSSTTISLEEEKVKVQKDLADSLRKAISIGIEIPEITGFDDDNATVYIKVNVINPIDRIANTSNFPIQINYDDIEGIPGVSTIFANEAGMIQKLPASAYNIVSAASQTGDQSLDALLNSYSSAYSEGCSGSISFMETKDCIITKEYSNMPMNNTTEKTN